MEFLCAMVPFKTFSAPFLFVFYASCDIAAERVHVTGICIDLPACVRSKIRQGGHLHAKPSVIENAA